MKLSEAQNNTLSPGATLPAIAEADPELAAEIEKRMPQRILISEEKKKALIEILLKLFPKDHCEEFNCLKCGADYQSWGVFRYHDGELEQYCPHCFFENEIENILPYFRRGNETH